MQTSDAFLSLCAACTNYDFRCTLRCPTAARALPLPIPRDGPSDRAPTPTGFQTTCRRGEFLSRFAPQLSAATDRPRPLTRPPSRAQPPPEAQRADGDGARREPVCDCAGLCRAHSAMPHRKILTPVCLRSQKEALGLDKCIETAKARMARYQVRAVRHASHFRRFASHVPRPLRPQVTPNEHAHCRPPSSPLRSSCCTSRRRRRRSTCTTSPARRARRSLRAACRATRRAPSAAAAW